jgi:hypothetical protein
LKKLFHASTKNTSKKCLLDGGNLSFFERSFQNLKQAFNSIIFKEKPIQQLNIKVLNATNKNGIINDSKFNFYPFCSDILFIHSSFSFSKTQLSGIVDEILERSVCSM